MSLSDDLLRNAAKAYSRTGTCDCGMCRRAVQGPVAAVLDTLADSDDARRYALYPMDLEALAETVREGA